MLHVRIVSPQHCTADVVERLQNHRGVINVIVIADVGRKPQGDLITCDIARRRANDVFELLEEFEVEQNGSIAVERVDLTMSRAGGGSDEDGEGRSDDAVVWEEFSQHVEEDSYLRWSFLVFLIVAVLIATIGVTQDSVILVIGAMVLGPEFGPISAVSFGVMRADLRTASRACYTLLRGFVAAIAVAAVLIWLCYLVGWFTPSMLRDLSGQTAFLMSPDKWSVIVAMLAGTAGILSLTSDKSSLLVGVFISVTTVPAAACIALAIALQQWDLVGLFAAQLGLNLAGLVVAGCLTLAVLRSVWGVAGLHRRVWQSRRH